MMVDLGVLVSMCMTFLSVWLAALCSGSYSSSRSWSQGQVSLGYWTRYISSSHAQAENTLASTLAYDGILETTFL